MRRAREARALATAVASSVLGNSPTISHLLPPVCTHSSYCFHLAMNKFSVSHSPELYSADSVQIMFKRNIDIEIQFHRLIGSLFPGFQHIIRVPVLMRHALLRRSQSQNLENDIFFVD